MEIRVRGEKASDVAAVGDVVRRAFANVGYSDGREHLMVTRLRGSDAYLSRLALVAEVGREMVGFIMLTRVRIRGSGWSVPALGLAPLAVVPAFQGVGVGTRLVREAHRRAKRLGFRTVTVLGHPNYYPRFGYGPMADHGLRVPFDIRQSNCMVAFLVGTALPGASGTVEYPPEFMQ